MPLDRRSLGTARARPPAERPPRRPLRRSGVDPTPSEQRGLAGIECRGREPSFGTKLARGALTAANTLLPSFYGNMNMAKAFEGPPGGLRAPSGGRHRRAPAAAAAAAAEPERAPLAPPHLQVPGGGHVAATRTGGGAAAACGGLWRCCVGRRG